MCRHIAPAHFRQLEKAGANQASKPKRRPRSSITQLANPNLVSLRFQTSNQVLGCHGPPSKKGPGTENNKQHSPEKEFPTQIRLTSKIRKQNPPRWCRRRCTGVPRSFWPCVPLSERNPPLPFWFGKGKPKGQPPNIGVASDFEYACAVCSYFSQVKEPKGNP